MKKEKNVSISNPDELNKHLQSSSPATWIVLGATIAVMLAFFVWSSLYTLPIRLSGAASVEAGRATLVVDEKDEGKLPAGEKVYILDQAGVVSYLDGKPIVLDLALPDGNYTYRTDIVLQEIHLIEFLFKS